MIDDIHWRSFPLTGEEEVEEKVIIHTLWMLLWPSPAQGWLSPWLCGTSLSPSWPDRSSLEQLLERRLDPVDQCVIVDSESAPQNPPSAFQVSSFDRSRRGRGRGLRLETDGWQQYPQSTCNGCSSQEAETGELDLGFGWEWKQCQYLTNPLAPDFDNHLERKKIKFPKIELWVRMGKLFLQF